MSDLSALTQLVSLAFSGTSLLGIIKLSFSVGRFLQRFETLADRVDVHDQLLGVPTSQHSQHKTATQN